MGRNLAKAADLLQAPVRRAPILSDVKDGRCPKCGCRALARAPGEAELNCLVCGAVIYEAPAVALTYCRVA